MEEKNKTITAGFKITINQNTPTDFKPNGRIIEEEYVYETNQFGIGVDDVMANFTNLLLVAGYHKDNIIDWCGRFFFEHNPDQVAIDAEELRILRNEEGND